MNPKPAQAFFQFGIDHPDYDVRVLNERAVRASAGILFALGLVCLMNAWLVGNFAPTRVFVMVFLLDFSIRIFINPRFAPSLIVSQWVVRKQTPEWVGAPQKRFAWAIGWALAAMMAYLMVFNRMLGPANLLTCGLCLALMFFESAFGICLGCKLYSWLRKQPAQLCPGGVCEAPRFDAPRTTWPQWGLVAGLAVYTVLIWSPLHDEPTVDMAQHSSPMAPHAQATTPSTASEEERCKVPAFAKAMGHEEKWKLHNNCS